MPSTFPEDFELVRGDPKGDDDLDDFLEEVKAVLAEHDQHNHDHEFTRHLGHTGLPVDRPK